MGTVAVEAVGVAGVLGVFDFEQLARVIECPAVERAGVGRLVAAFEATEHGTAMAASVDKRIEFTRLVARDNNRLTPHVGGVVVVVLRDLALMRHVQPVAFEEVFHLQIKQPRVGEHFALTAEDAFLFIVLQQAVQVVESQVHGHGSVIIVSTE